MASDTGLSIREDAAKQRFVVNLEGQEAYATFGREGETITFLHTYVPPELEGRGVAGQLAKHALDYARENGLQVVPVCPFVRAYLARHPEYGDLVKHA